MKSYAKRRRSSKKKTFRRRGKGMNRMQKAAYSIVKKKYTTVEPIIMDEDEFELAITISHLAGRNATDPASTLTLHDANPDNMALADMKQYQFFRITGVSYKIFFPEGTTPEATPVQWSMAYSANNILNPGLTSGPFQSMATYQTSSCSANRPVKRFFKTASTLKRLGIEWVSTAEYPNFGVTPPVALYGDQLPINAGSSTLFKIFRASTAVGTRNAVGRVQLTYYI